MSLKGVIKGIDVSEGTNVSTFDKAMSKYKSAIAKLTRLDFNNNSDHPQGLIEGIVQGDIKLSANNNWNSTLYYGFTDAAGKVGFEGTQASSLLKLSNTLMSATGYTLGGTGPASKKMYQGSNLSGFTVQFKWYTPLMMTGWKEAIQALTILAWPTTKNALDPVVGAKVEGPPLPAEGTPIGTVVDGLKSVIAEHTNDANSLLKIINSSLGAVDLFEIAGTPAEFRAKFPLNSRFGDVMYEYNRYADASPKDRMNMHNDYTYRIFTSNNMEKSIKKDKTNLEALAGTFQFNVKDIGSDSSYWDDTDNPSINPNLQPMNVNGVAAASTPSKPPQEISVTGAFKDLFSGTTQLLSGMMESIAVNPPKVSLEIFSGTSLKYRLAPLIITGFTINASRETIDGEPVIVTVDITFDYYMVNATGAKTGEGQLFAGSPIFSLSKTPTRN